MPRKKRSASPFELMDDDFDEDASSQGSRCDNPPIQRNAANARERARMRVLSSAFGRLKTKLPNIPSDTKLSKLDTLRLATMYIKQLKAVVEGTAPLSTNAALGGDHDNDGALNDTTPSCYLQLHSGAQSMNWPFGLHHQVNHHSNARSQTTSSAASNGNTTSAGYNCQTEAGNPSKYSRYETENYHQEHHEELPTPVSLGHHHQDNPSSYLLITSSSSPSTALLTTPPNPTQQPETVWYSETPSPDLSNSSSGGGLGGGYDSSHTTPQQQRHNNLMEHLSHMQLTPPPSHSASASRQFQQQQHQHQHLLHHHNHHHHHPHQSNHNQQYSNHLHHPQHHHLSTPALHHQNFANSQNLTSASIR